MYKIYINDTPVYFKDLAVKDSWPLKNDSSHLAGRYTGVAKSLLNYADMLEKGRDLESVTLFTDDLPGLQQDFLSLFTLIEAAGGIVCTPEGKVLLIFRLGHWDLPKGKIEPGEAPQEAALREVEEETGLHGLTLQDHFQTTYHTYRLPKGKRIVKRTYWYTMQAPEQPLTPQTEEDIQIAVWKVLSDCLHHPDYPFYRSIHDLLTQFDAQNNAK